MKKSARDFGEFCWFDVMTRDLESTKTAFAKILGWTFQEASIPSGGSLSLVQCAGRVAGAVHDLTHDPRGANVPAHIGVHVMVKDADQTAQAVEEYGGKLLAPVMEIGENGRMCVFKDPTGAVLCCWQPKAQVGMNVEPTVHGAPSWIELFTHDVQRAADFYGKIFNWKPVSKLEGRYTEFVLGDIPVAGMLAITPEMGAFPPYWGCYFSVNDVDQAIKDATQIGWRLCVPPMLIEGVGRLASLTSAEGYAFCVIKWIKR